MTSTSVYYENDIEEALNLECACGHKLSYHAFTWGFDDFGHSGFQNYVRVSQCTQCPIDMENRKFGCEHFRWSEE